MRVNLKFYCWMIVVHVSNLPSINSLLQPTRNRRLFINIRPVNAQCIVSIAFPPVYLYAPRPAAHQLKYQSFLLGNSRPRLVLVSGA